MLRTASNDLLKYQLSFNFITDIQYICKYYLIMPARKRNSLESGFETDSDSTKSHSALERYYANFVPQLEAYLASENFDNDPSIDLNDGEHLMCRASTPIKDHHPSGHEVQSREASLSELQFLKNVFMQNEVYCEKLTSLMLADLKRTFGPCYKHFIEQGGLPETFFPEVRLNSDNKPYINFRIISQDSDEPPFTANYSIDHYGCSNYIIRRLMEASKRGTNSSKNQICPRQPKPQQQQLHQHQQPQSQHQQHHQQPQHQQQQQQHYRRNKSPATGLNDSRRIMPWRSCRKSLEGSYRV